MRQVEVVDIWLSPWVSFAEFVGDGALEADLNSVTWASIHEIPHDPTVKL
jgi:hypothetical protein